MSNGNKPAAPVPGMDMQDIGLTKRELFAAMAMQGMAEKYGTTDASGSENVAKNAVRYADALLAALEQGEDDER